MDGQMRLDICKTPVIKVSHAELMRSFEEQEERYWDEIAEKILMIERRHEREKLRLATECDGQMELEDYICLH